MKKIFLSMLALGVMNSYLIADDYNYKGISHCVVIAKNGSLLNLKYVYEAYETDKYDKKKYYTRFYFTRGESAGIYGTKKQIDKVVETFKKCSQ